MVIKNYHKTLSTILFCLLTLAIQAQLNYENFVYNGSGGGALMDQASAVAVSPDGDYVYVTSSGSNAINVFNKSISSPDGQLTFVEVIKTGLDGVQGLTAAQSVAVSPDGNNVYAVGNFDDALVTFDRSHVNGTLTYLGMHKDGLGGVDGLDAPFMVKVSPDGKHVYVTATDDKAISIFERNETTGLLTFKSKMTDPSLNVVLGFDISSDGNHIYAAGHADGKVVVFSRNASTGLLTYVEAIQDNVNFVDGLSGAFSVFVSPDGINVYVTGVYDNAVAIFARDTDDGTLTFMEIQQDGQNGVDFMAFPFNVSGSADGNYIYALGANDNAINVFERNPTNGILTFKSAQVEGNVGVNGLNYPVHIAVSPDGNQVYTAANGSGAAVVFKKQNDGSLSFTESQENGTNGVAGLGKPYSLTVSPDGKNVYAAAYDDNSVVMFSRSEATGNLTYIDMLQDGEDGVDGLYRAYSITVSPDGKHAYATGNNDDALVIFNRDETTGALTFVEKIKDGVNGVDGLNGARFVTVSDDGNFVYVAAYYDDAISVFQRNASTGGLTYIQIVEDGENGVDGLNGANSFAISADGNFAYATGYADDAIVSFSRDPADGTLVFIEEYKNGFANVNGLNGAHSAVLSSDGKSFYVCGYNDNSVSAFSRNTTTGKLTFVEMYKDGVNGIDGLTGARAVALNPDGTHFYAVSGGENAIVLFERNENTSELTYQFKHEDGIDNVNGLSGSRFVTLDPFGRHIYVAGADDDAIAVFSCTYFETMTEEICQGGSVTIGNNVYTETGVYDDVLSDTYGCISQVTLDLTVLSTSESLTETICFGETYELGNQTLTESGTYQNTVTNGLGCEVNTTLNLTIATENTISTAAEICQGDTYNVGANSFFETGVYENILTASSGCDSVVFLELTVNPTSFNDNVSICFGDQYTLGNQTLNSSGTYQETFTSNNGCDSVVTLQLAVVSSFSENLNQTICEGGSYNIGDSTYTEAGTYTNTLNSASGCDSVVTLNLSVEQDISVLVNETICEGEEYFFNGTNLIETGLYSETLTTVGGCDSTVSVNLTVLPGVPPTLNEVICEGESYNFGNNIYTESGVYTSTFSSPNGCETLVTLTLNVQASQEVLIGETICEGEQYPFGSQLLTDAGTYVGNFNTLSGCDSTVTLTLNVNPVQEYELFETICKDDIYIVGNETYTSTGTYTIELNSAVTGCDSIVTLNLTVVDINGGALITNDDGTGIGAVNLTVSNGTPPYVFEWSNGADTEDVNGLTDGTYEVVVSDANGCSETFSFTVDNSTGIFSPASEVTFVATVHPNPAPTNGELNIQISNNQDQIFEFRLFDSVGKIIENEKVQMNTGEQVQRFTAPQNAGLYYLQIINENQETKSLKIIIH
ncbi:MAG: beta-propeller fold lactonase family protein [Saprospiraceae bacterium]